MDFLNLIIALEIGIMNNKKIFQGIMLEKKRDLPFILSVICITKSLLDKKVIKDNAVKTVGKMYYRRILVSKFLDF